MIEMQVPRSRVFYENFLPGAVVICNNDTYGVVVGSDSENERAQLINAEMLRDVLLELLARWEASGGEVDDALSLAINDRRVTIRSPSAVYIAPFPLLLQCSGPQCGLIDAPGRTQRSARVGALASRIRSANASIACRDCGAPLEQLPFVQVHRCGRLGEIDPPMSARGRRLRFHDGGTFFRSHWVNFDSGENIGRAFHGECQICATRHAGKQGTVMVGAKLRGGRSETFYSQLVQYISLQPETTELLATFRGVVRDPTELGRAVVCGLFGLQAPPELRANMKAIIQGGEGTRLDLAALRDQHGKLTESLEKLRALSGMEAAVQALEERRRSLERDIHRTGGLFAAANLYVPDTDLLAQIGLSRQAREAALIRGDFRESSLDQDIAVASQSQRTFLEETRTALLRDYGVREVRHIDDLAVVVAAAGFTRQMPEPSAAPGEVPLRLNAFTDEVTDTLSGRVPIYGMYARTEAILIRLDPSRVLSWAIENLGWDTPTPEILNESHRAHAHILRVAPALVGSPGEVRQATLSGLDRYGGHILGLLHTVTHALLHAAQNGSGYDGKSLVEYMFPADLSALIFVSSRKDFTMGGLQALYQYNLLTWFEEAAHASVTCIFDPVCSEQGGSCHGCLQLALGCQTFNHGISRAYIHGGPVDTLGGQTLSVRSGFWA